MAKQDPKYVCLSQNSRGEVVTADSHTPGPLVSASQTARLRTCAACGLVYWEPISQQKPKDDGRCHGVTQYGKRCRLDAQPGSDYCGHHKHLDIEAGRLLLSDLV